MTSHALMLVREQARDEALWFRAETVEEAYLQQALRALHAAVELDAPGGCPMWARPAKDRE